MSCMCYKLWSLRDHSFITYAQIPGFQVHRPTLYAQIMTSLRQQYIGVRMALDPPTPFGAYVINEWPLIHVACNIVYAADTLALLDVN